MDSQLAANIISSIAAASTLAVVVIAYIAIKDNRKQARQTQFDSSRPLLVPEGILLLANEQNPKWLSWGEYQLTDLHIRNMGSGVALNIACVLYPPSTYVIDGKPSDNYQEEHWTCWLGSPIAPGDKVEELLRKGDGLFSANRKYIRRHGREYTFNAPPEPLNKLNEKEPMHLARLIITYQDVFHRKHASIFDMLDNIGWKQIAFEEDIKEDLHDLQG